MKTYEITSVEGQEFAATGGILPEIGAEVELDLEPDQETALVAAGWLSEPAKKKKEG